MMSTGARSSDVESVPINLLDEVGGSGKKDRLPTGGGTTWVWSISIVRKHLDQVVVDESKSPEAANEVDLEHLPLARP